MKLIMKPDSTLHDQITVIPHVVETTLYFLTEVLQSSATNKNVRPGRSLKEGGRLQEPGAYWVEFLSLAYGNCRDYPQFSKRFVNAKIKSISR